MKFSMCIGGLTYNIDCLTKHFYEKYGKAFECPYSENGYNISVTKSELSAFCFYDDKASLSENETAYFLDKVIKHCLDYNRMIIHGATISYCGNGYMFIAPSGTGKTTHIKLWEKYLKDVEIINGDKPMLNFDNGITICGTPWNGKEHYGGNLYAPLKAIVVLKQGKINSFNKLNNSDSIISLLKQCFYSVDKIYSSKVISYIEQIVKNIPIFSLECNISKEAFDTCYNGLNSYGVLK